MTQPTRQKRTWITIALIALAAGLGFAIGHSNGGSENTRSSARLGTATVTKGALVAREEERGTLGYGEPRSVRAPKAGVVTRSAEEGAVLSPGQALVSVGEEPLFLLKGSIPAYREMYRGISKGRDVLQLERNLRALRLDKDGRITPDQTFDSRTEDAVKRLQRRLGFEDDGVVKAGQVVFMPGGSARVARRVVGIGGYAPQGAPVLNITSLTREVTVPLEAGSADIAKTGDTVEVELPDDSIVKGKVISVGSEARSPAGNPDGAPVIDVKVALRGGTGSKSEYDSAPVTVSFVKESARDVLYVPVTALVALRGGGFAVEVRSGSDATKLIRVTPGLFADGNVEVAGSKLRSGMKVVVPK